VKLPDVKLVSALIALLKDNRSLSRLSPSVKQNSEQSASYG